MAASDREMIAAAIEAGRVKVIPAGQRSIPLKKEEPEVNARPTFSRGHALPGLSQIDGDTT